MVLIIWVAVFVSAIWYMNSVKGKVRNGGVADQLSGGEKLYMWVASFLNPILVGAIFYYGWRIVLPYRAKQANCISLWAFLIWTVLCILYIVLTYPEILAKI